MMTVVPVTVTEARRVHSFGHILELFWWSVGQLNHFGAKDGCQNAPRPNHQVLDVSRVFEHILREATRAHVEGPDRTSCCDSGRS